MKYKKARMLLISRYKGEREMKVINTRPPTIVRALYLM